MRVKMLTTSAGPDGVHQAGETVDLPEETAERYIEGGFAEGVPDHPVAPAAEEAETSETATAEAPENTARPRAPRRTVGGRRSSGSKE